MESSAGMCRCRVANSNCSGHCSIEYQVDLGRVAHYLYHLRWQMTMRICYSEVFWHSYTGHRACSPSAVWIRVFAGFVPSTLEENSPCWDGRPSFRSSTSLAYRKALASNSNLLRPIQASPVHFPKPYPFLVTSGAAAFHSLG